MVTSTFLCASARGHRALQISALALAAGLLYSEGCSDGSRATQTASVTDSSGIEIVVSKSPAWGVGQEWQVAGQPILTVGGASDDKPDRIFDKIVSAFRLGDGGVFVVDQSSNHVRIFDSTGKLVRTAGRAGTGPGEFGTIAGAFRLAGDTIAIAGRRRDITWLTGSGDVAKAFSPADVHSYAFAMFTDGGIVANPLNAGPYRAPPTPVQNSRGTSNAKAYYSINHIADRDGKSVHDLGKIEHSKRTGGAFELLYPARLYRVARERYYVGYSEEYSIKVFDKQGRLVRIVRREVQPVPVSRQEEDEAREVRRRLVPPQAIYDMEQVPFLEPSEHHPFFSEILVDASEHLWVREYRKREDGLYRSVPQAVEGGQAQKFNIFDTAGLWLGSVDLPNQLQVTDIGTNYILGIWRDSDLVESIRIYALDRRRDSR